MLAVTTNSEAVMAKARQIADAVTRDGSFDQPVEIAAWRCHFQLTQITPKRWTGNLRKNWKVDKPGPGQRLVYNDSKIMLFLEGGTGWAGTPTSNGGYIYPKTKKFLFIPLNARAAIGGWNQSLVYGRDYILRRRVRGIKARHYVRNFRPKAREILKEEMRRFLEKVLK